MKFIILFLVALQMSCASIESASEKKSLTFANAQSIVKNDLSAKEVIQTLGEPSNKTEDKNQYTLHYEDDESKNQRLSISFLKENDRIDNALWIPISGERESSLSQIRATFKDARLQAIEDSNQNSNTYAEDYIMYVDTGAGITIRFNTADKEVEAIVVYKPDSRMPAEKSKSSL